MQKKSIFTWFIWVITFGIIFWYSLVFAWAWMFDDNASITFKSSDNIYLDSIELNKTKILFKSGNDLSNYKIKSECNIFSKLISAKWEYYMFDLKFFDNDCENQNFVLVDSKNEIKASFKLNLLTEYKIISKMLDLPTDELSHLKLGLNRKIELLSKYTTYDEAVNKDYYDFLQKNRALKEWTYTLNIIKNILTKRSEKYIVPVPWHKIPTSPTKIPNSAREYRKDYTDAIHHGWDIDWKLWEQVVALDDWIIVRTVNNFEFSDLKKLNKSKKLTSDDLIRNLDVLRWNQVWLKTMHWDVIFYSHLNEIFSNIKVWEVVKKWQPLWTIWKTWVPDENYIDYHLHFEVQKNPFNLWKDKSYDIDDYLKWNWLFKWNNKDYILENQFNYFEN